MELHADFLGELVTALDADARARRRRRRRCSSFDDRGVIDGAGDVLRWSGVVMPRGRGERDRGQYDDAAEVFSACGGAALYRRAAFDEVGPFDEAFFAQMEDVDWGFRARLLGYGCRYVPGAVVYHKGSASMRREGRPDPWFWGLAGAQLHLDVEQELPARRACCATRICCSRTSSRASTSRRARAWCARSCAPGGMRCAGCRGCCASGGRSRRARRIGRRELDRVIERGGRQLAAARRARAPRPAGARRALALRFLGVVPRDEAAAALAPRAGDRARRAAEVGHDLAGAAAGAAGSGGRGADRSSP